MTATDALRRLELTAGQRGLWYAQQLDPDNVVLNIAHYLDVPGELDAAAYEQAWRTAIDETDALHAGFAEDDDGPHQLVADGVDWRMRRVDVRGETDPEAAARAWMDADLRSRVDLSTPPLFTVALLRVADDRTFCYQRIHHLALDGYGATLLMLRVNVVYNALVTGAEVDEPFTAPLSDLVADDLDYRAGDRTDDSAFWSELLADHPSPTLLAEPPQGLPDRLERCTRDVPAATVEALAAAAREMKVSRSSLLIAAFGAYLHRFTGSADVVLGLPVTARRGKVAKSAPGMVSNIVPLRLDVRPETPLTELAAQVSSRVRALLKHQRYRPEDIRADLGLERDARLTGPTINILPIEGTLDFGGHESTLHNLSVGPVDDLSVVVSRAPDGQGLRIDVDANPDLYDAAALEGHLERFLVTLDALARDHTTSVGRIRVASDSDRDILGEATRGTAVDVLHRTILDFFEAQVRRTPDAVAVAAPDATLSFNEMDRRANRLARELLARGVGPGSAVAVALPRRSSFPIALAAAHKAGAVVMPVDPAYPAQRIAQMISDVAPRVVITDLETGAGLPELSGSGHLLHLDAPDVVADVLGRSNDPVAEADRGAPVRPEDPSYVVYTSGSTGRPKGIVVPHRSLVNLFASHSAQIFAPARAAVGGSPLRVAHITPVSFDAGWDPILWLVGGHELHLVDERTMADPEALVRLLVEQSIDFLETTPTYMAQLVSAGLLRAADDSGAGDSVRVVALGGEAVGRELWDFLGSREGLLAFNLFGPAESTVDVVTARIGESDDPVIGRPVANTRAYVLDPGLSMMPVGATGELYLAGAGLARAYLHQPGRTAERFVADPYGGPGDRMYRTGDLARWRADGTLEFVDRVDDQVKLRGFRVELGEIEARLDERLDVHGAAVVVRESDGVQSLVAYVVGDPDELSPADLRESVAAAVPAYMVPSLYVVLERLPLTANGKLDRDALPAPTGDASAAGAGRAPQTPHEQLLAGLFAETLGLAEVGVDDDFFTLGGHSLLATRLVSRIRSAAGVEVPIRDLFDHPTVAGLAGRLAGASQSRAELRAMPRPDVLPLSPAQRRLWFVQQLQPDSAAYNIPAQLRLRGELDVDALRRAVHDLVSRHETLRTRFAEVDGEPRQVVVDADDVPDELPVVEVTAADDLDAVLRTEAARGFDLADGCPLRVRLFRVAPDDHVLSLVLHHVAGDGWSLGPLAGDLAEAYAARRDGGLPPDWSPLPVQYADYTLWQREVLGEEDDEDSEISRQLAHWRDRLAGLPAETELPRDRARPREPATDSPTEGTAVPVSLDADLRDALAAIAARHEVSLFMVLEAALAALLGRMGAGDDVAVGVPIAGRTDEALDGLVGFFVNTLVIRNDLSGDPSFDDLVDRVKDTALDAYAHQDVPFERVVEELSPERSLTRHPLFQVMLAFQNTGALELHLPGLDVSVDAAAGPAGAKFDLSVDLAETDTRDDDAGTRTQIAGSVTYDPVLFDRRTVVDLVARLERLLRAVAADPAAGISQAALLDHVERADALASLDARDAAAPPGTVLDTFAATVAGSPDAVALRVPGHGDLTYAELDARSARLAAVLVGAGHSGHRVGVALPRTPDLLVALLAVLRAGAVYLPIDTEYPRTRIEHIVTDAAPATVITDGSVLDRLPGGTPVLRLDDDQTRRLLEDADPTGLPIPTPGDAAYLTYTSGSTGRPKGVLVEHGALANLHAHQRRELHDPTAELLGRRVRMAHTTAVSFDAAWDPVLWMLSGHTLVLVDDETRRDPEGLTRLVRDEGIDAIETTPSYVQALLAEGLAAEDGPAAGPSLVLLGGEAVPASLWADLRALDGVRSVNLYGPTEACVDTVVADLADTDSPVLGRPVAGVAAYVLDAALQPVPVGVAGELYLAGAALARGYAGRGAETAARFVADPYGAPGARMYRTGDLARRTRDGELAFVGRVDDQVKVRGYRVELGEIESVLAEQPGVSAAAVDVRTDAAGGDRLVAWLVAPDDSVDGVRVAAREALPDYMVPVAWTTTDALPLTPNGKLDRARLPDVALAGGDEGGRAAGTEAERALAQAYADVLGLEEPVAVDVSFFDLGGHSLLATRLVSRVRNRLGVELAVRTLFEAPSVEQLAARLPAAGTARRRLVATGERPARIPLSWAQRRLWFLNRLEDASAAYHIPLAVRLDGDLDVEALQAALDDLTARHEVLRTTLPETDGEPHQLVDDQSHVPLEVVRTSTEDLAAALRERAETPFDLAADRPLRASLLRLGPDQHVLLLVVHHVAADGWSMGPLARDLATAYDARRAGGAPATEPLAVQYADYALWQRDTLGEADDETSELATQLGWWTEHLAGLPAELDLPTDRPRPVRGSNRGGEVAFELSADLHARLVETARAHDASPFMLLQATLAALLTRLGGGTDVPLGSPVAGRTDEALDDLVGFFVNTVVLRTDTSGDPTLPELLARVRDSDLDAFAHADLPFERLVEAMAPERSMSRHPLFQVMLTATEESPTDLGLAGLTSRVEPVQAGSAKFDLSFSVTERHGDDGVPAGVDGVLEHSLDLYDAGSAEAVAARWVRLLEAWLDEPEAPLGAVPLLTDEERRAVLPSAVRVEVDPATPRTVLEAWEETVARQPGATALVATDETLTFAELSERVDQLAGALAARGIGRGDVVGLAVPRSAGTVVALLGILRAGATYLPLDVSQPAARLDAVSRAARPALVIDADLLAELLRGTDAVPELPQRLSMPPMPQPGDAAYVLFTSGSTGVPKGVVVEHASLAALLGHHRTTLFDPARDDLGRPLRVAHTTAVTFDASWDPVLWLVAGHELHLVDDETRTDPEALVALLGDAGIDAIETTPSYVAELLELGLGDLAVTALGGEAVGVDLWRELSARPGRAVNLYGPTETTVDAVTAEIGGAAGTAEHPVIGSPVTGARAYVLDDRLEPVAPGIRGELYLAGAGLARAYLDRPDLTAERFVADPHGAPGARMYRTGDHAWWTAAPSEGGTLAFGGRADEQVKIRGFRVEPGEVDAALADADGVVRAATVVVTDAAGADALASYLVTEDGRDLDVETVRAHAAERLPAYMLPTALTVVDALPLTPNGKLDRRALPAPELVGGGGRPPRTPTERLLVDVFAEVLGVEGVGVDDGFFELGGHSLLATRLVSRIRAAADVELPVAALFEASTPADLARRIDGDRDGDGSGGSAALQRALVLRDDGARTPLVAVHPVAGLAWPYAGLVPHLDDRPVLGLQTPGLTDADPLPDDVDALVDGYVTALRRLRPEGPYALLGWSLGGVLAHRVAARLLDQGDRVEHLVLVDSYPGALPDGSDGGSARHRAPDDLVAGYREAQGERAEALLEVLDDETVTRLTAAVTHLGDLLRDAGEAPVLAVPTTIVTAVPGHVGAPLAEQWAPYLDGPVAEHEVPHHHHDLMEPAALVDLGPLVADALDRVPE